MPTKITHFETHGMFAVIPFREFRAKHCRNATKYSDFDTYVVIPTIDVRFPTSLTGDGTDAMCVPFDIP
jgi:hypothetical protein